jgi:hypothetical protein
VTRRLLGRCHLVAASGEPSPVPRGERDGEQGDALRQERHVAHRCREVSRGEAPAFRLKGMIVTVTMKVGSSRTAETRSAKVVDGLAGSSGHDQHEQAHRRLAFYGDAKRLSIMP